MLRQHMIVYGHVQGVGFRQYTKQTALRHSVQGWVRNRPDGTVEIDAQGTEEKMKQFVKSIQLGSPASQVERIEVSTRKPEENSRSFTIRY
ncbi:acylphosphatase [Melghirimyces algeriensis]|uniref:Acylphosphatase n=1 Tax=Melghirimyces algeriensis TaxID=910412 RepID=A0A521B8X0_9BACL|nr:acylphosphatase [Melghirimyces algeriensis]SMO43527.1 acylphosphatase [Melghirimyces algeriensis]